MTDIAVAGKLPNGTEFSITVDVLVDENLIDQDPENSPGMLRFYVLEKKDGEWEEVPAGSYCTAYCEGQEALCTVMIEKYKELLESGQKPFVTKTFEEMSWGLDIHRVEAAYYWPNRVAELSEEFLTAETTMAAFQGLGRLEDLLSKISKILQTCVKEPDSTVDTGTGSDKVE